MTDVLSRNNVVVLGKGAQPMVFAHGFGCDQHMWSAIVPAFEEAYRVVLFDYVGSGRSNRSAFDALRYSTLAGYAQDLLEVIEALDLRDIVFVGHSVSSIIGVLASLQAPERFSRLALIGPSACYINAPPDYIGGFERSDLEGLFELMDKNYFGWADFLAPVVMGNADRPEHTETLRNSFCSTDPVVARRFAETTFFADNRGDLKRVTVPSLILQCADDAIAPPSAGRFVAEEIPFSTFVEMAATGHCPHVSHPEETIRRIKDFLAA